MLLGDEAGNERLARGTGKCPRDPEHDDQRIKQRNGDRAGQGGEKQPGCRRRRQRGAGNHRIFAWKHVRHLPGRQGEQDVGQEDAQADQTEREGAAGEFVDRPADCDVDHLAREGVKGPSEIKRGEVAMPEGGEAAMLSQGNTVKGARGCRAGCAKSPDGACLSIAVGCSAYFSVRPNGPNACSTRSSSVATNRIISASGAWGWRPAGSTA